MKYKNALRAKLVLVGGIALAVSLSRCSPLASSFDKNGRHGGSLTSGSFPIPGSPNGIHVFVYKTRVLDGETYASTVSPIPSAQKLVLADASAAFADFKTHRQVQIALPETFAPDEGSGYFEVTASAPDISDFDLVAFETTFKPIADGTWLLSVSPSVPDDVARRVLDSLVEITISVNTSVGTSGSGLSAGTTPAAAATGPTGAPTGATGSTGPSGAR